LTTFAIIAVLLTLVAVGLVVLPLLRAGTGAHPVAATLTAVAIPATVLVVYLLVSNHDWQSAGESAPGAGPMDEAIAALEQRLAATPDDEEGWILLGSSYLSLNRPADSLKAYQRALEVSGGRSVAARLGVAEARIVLDPASLPGPLGDEIEAVLAEEPGNAKALWYGGLLALARSQPALARERWQALLTLDPPARVREVIEAQLAELDGGLAAAGASAPGPGAPPAAGGVGIQVSVSVADDVLARVSPSAPLFIFVRDAAAAAGPPLAVVKRSAGELPLSIRISDADLMLPGRTLASLTAATLVARIANGGDPVARPGDVQGEARWQAGTGAAAPVSILIDQVVGP